MIWSFSKHFHHIVISPPLTPPQGGGSPPLTPPQGGGGRSEDIVIYDSSASLLKSMQK